MRLPILYKAYFTCITVNLFSECCNISVTSGAYYTAESEKNQDTPRRFGTIDGRFHKVFTNALGILGKYCKKASEKEKNSGVKRLTFAINYDILIKDF